MASELNQRLALMSIENMFKGGYFSICAFDSAVKVLNVQVASVDYAALRGIHCMDWADMDPTTRKLVKARVCELLGIQWEEPAPVKVTAPPSLVEDIVSSGSKKTTHQMAIGFIDRMKELVSNGKQS